MCGIFGCTGTLSTELLERVSLLLAHRGPDDRHDWISPTHDLTLVHRRLSIVDTSDRARQPMMSHSGRHVLTFNGEIYNFQTLAGELAKEGIALRSTSDTEVLVEAIEHWGIDRTLERIEGMFAFGVYDRDNQILSIARDRIGIKPLYYAEHGEHFAFSSELSPLKLLPWVSDAIDSASAAEFLRRRYISAPNTILQQVKKVVPGTVLQRKNGKSVARTYWSLRAISELPRANHRSLKESVAELKDLLRVVVKEHLIADRPIGAFLSGGIDSSVVIAMMKEIRGCDVDAFTLGFTGNWPDEVPFARDIAQSLGVRHHVLTVTPSDVQDSVARIADYYDEPFADASAVPTFLISSKASARVTVALTGDGGDELFGGYPHYSWAPLISTARLLPFSSAAAEGARNILRIMPALRGLRRFGGTQGLAIKLDRLAKHLRAPIEEFIQDAGLVLSEAEAQAIIQGHCASPASRRHQIPSSLSVAEQMMLHDQLTWLADDILVKLDRATMRAGIEGRVPLLDRRIVEWSWRLPTSHKVSALPPRGKRVLAALAHDYIPRSLLDRPKRGFGLPLADWCRGTLRPWIIEALSPSRVQRIGVLDSAVVAQTLTRYLSTGENFPLVWNLAALVGWACRAPVQASSDSRAIGL